MSIEQQIAMLVSDSPSEFPILSLLISEEEYCELVGDSDDEVVVYANNQVIDVFAHPEVRPGGVTVIYDVSGLLPRGEMAHG